MSVTLRENRPIGLDAGHSGTAIEPFTIAVEDEVLRDLRMRLAAARSPHAISGSGWDYGADLEYIRDLAFYWREHYDWRRHEAELNRIGHFRTVIDGQNFHFAHVRSRHANAVPLIMVHGWPGSIVEFLDVVGPLTAPEEHGGRIEEACHLIMPSLPGFGFSGPTRERGWNPRRTAQAYVELMSRLGYRRYAAQGGDWGAIVTTEMAILDPGHMIGLHSNHPIAGPPAEQVELSPQDQTDLADLGVWFREESAYSLLQGTKPQTIGFALNDSPIGLLAWIVEKFHSWSDNGLDRTIKRDRLLTNIMLYWVTGTAPSAARFYYEFYRQPGPAFDPEVFAKAVEPVTVPTTVARFPGEGARLPRAWIEARYNIVRWTDMPSGGHFAAMEEPELFARDVGAFVAGLVNGGT